MDPITAIANVLDTIVKSCMQVFNALPPDAQAKQAEATMAILKPAQDLLIRMAANLEPETKGQ